MRLKTGLTTLKKTEIEDYLKDMEKLPAFNFSIEKKGYKTGIANRVGAKDKAFKKKLVVKKKDEGNNDSEQKEENKEDENKLLVTLDVTIDEDRKETLEVYSKDDPKEVLDNFCEKFGIISNN